MSSASIDRLAASLARYAEAVTAEGFQAPTPPSEIDKVEEDLESIRMEVGPMRIPAEIEWFWRNCDTDSFDYRVSAFPDFSGPSDATGLADYEHWPRCLLPIGYQSHCYLAVELEYAGSNSNWVYCYDEGFEVIAPSLADFFDCLSQTIEAGDFMVDTDGSRFVLDHEIEKRRADLLVRADLPADQIGPFSMFELLEWPNRWRRQQGLGDDAGVPTGATHTVAQLHEARRKGSVIATIVGEKGGGVGGTLGSVTVVSDETGSIDVYIPPRVPELGLSETNRYEFDLVVERSVHLEPRLEDFPTEVHPVRNLARLADIRAAADPARRPRKQIQEFHPIVASAVRPL